VVLRCCVVFCGVVLCCVLWCGVVFCGVVWCGGIFKKQLVPFLSSIPPARYNYESYSLCTCQFLFQFIASLDFLPRHDHIVGFCVMMKLLCSIYMSVRVHRYEIEKV